MSQQLKKKRTGGHWAGTSLCLLSEEHTTHRSQFVFSCVCFLMLVSIFSTSRMAMVA